MKESIVRTVVPILYALLVRYGVTDIVGLNEAVAVELLTALVTGLLYAALRLLEKLEPRFGWLLGLPKAPTYDS